MSPRQFRAVQGAVVLTLVATAMMLAVALVPTAPARAQPDGMAAYQAQCGGCHSLDTNRVGPAHRGVVGRPVGSAPGYAYSAALRKLGGVWTPARLDQWLQGPQRLAPGSKMFLTVPDPAVRKAIIAYLSANSPPTGAKAR